jgi:3-oxoadipate enol-lactonase
MRVPIAVILLSLLSVVVVAQVSSSNRAVLKDTRLYFEKAGKGETIVFIHGWALDNRMWDWQWDYFSKRYNVIRYDVRGFGESDRAHDPHNPADELKELLDHLKIEKVHLVGHSMGGNIALNFAAKYPNRVHKVVVADTFLDGFDNNTPEFKTIFDNIVYLASHQGWHDEQQEVWLRSPLMRLYTAEDKAVISLSEMVADYNGDHFINPRINPEFGQPTTAELLTAIKAPTLVLIGQKDEESLQRISLLLTQKIPNVSKIVIKGAGHLPNMEKPKVFNKLINQFLK